MDNDQTIVPCQSTCKERNALVPKKKWQTPKLILSELSETDSNLGVGSDLNVLTS
jgi:hypothetical protein